MSGSDIFKIAFPFRTKAQYMALQPKGLDDAMDTKAPSEMEESEEEESETAVDAVIVNMGHSHPLGSLPGAVDIMRRYHKFIHPLTKVKPEPVCQFAGTSRLRLSLELTRGWPVGARLRLSLETTKGRPVGSRLRLSLEAARQFQVKA